MMFVNHDEIRIMWVSFFLSYLEVNMFYFFLINNITINNTNFLQIIWWSQNSITGINPFIFLRYNEKTKRENYTYTFSKLSFTQYFTNGNITFIHDLS